MPTDRTQLKALRQLAEIHGVLTSYVDMAKRTQRATPEALLGVLRALGVPVEKLRDAGAALRAEHLRQARQVIEPVQVAWSGGLRPIQV